MAHISPGGARAEDENVRMVFHAETLRQFRVTRFNGNLGC